MKTTKLLLVCMGLGFLAMTLQSCHKTPFKMRVDEVVYAESVDRVIMVGVVSEGSVKAGDTIAVRRGSQIQSMTVDRLVDPRQDSQRKMETAQIGDKVGLVIRGLRRDQVQSGDYAQSP